MTESVINPETEYFVLSFNACTYSKLISFALNFSVAWAKKIDKIITEQALKDLLY
jgi:hypothetical protein